jgi:hypothetical protein
MPRAAKLDVAIDALEVEVRATDDGAMLGVSDAPAGCSACATW